MPKKLKALWKGEMKRDVTDAAGWMVTKGSVVFVLRELTHPVSRKRLLAVRIDNGTGMLDLMPGTVVPADSAKRSKGAKMEAA